MPQANLDLADLRRLVNAMNALPRHQNLVAHWECSAAMRNAAPALLDEIERLRKVEDAARVYCDPGRHAHNCTKGTGMSWEPEYPCSCGLDALRKALGGEDGE